MTREEFEANPGRYIDPVDSMPTCKNAQPDCKTCKGHGIVDEGDFICALVICPDCWRKK